MTSCSVALATTLMGEDGSTPSKSRRSVCVPAPSVRPTWLRDVENHHTFLVSDLAGFVRGFTANLSLLTIIAVAMGSRH